MFRLTTDVTDMDSSLHTQSHPSENSPANENKQAFVTRLERCKHKNSLPAFLLRTGTSFTDISVDYFTTPLVSQPTHMGPTPPQSVYTFQRMKYLLK
jgi:hypothetical protein